MNGKQLLRCVLQHAPAFIESSLRGFGVDPASIDVVVSHQASRAGLQFIETQFERQGFTRARHVTTLDRYGNCVAASLPMTLHHALTEGGPSADGQPRPLPRGSNVLLLGAGAGVSSQAATMHAHRSSPSTGRTHLFRVILESIVLTRIATSVATKSLPSSSHQA